MAYTDEELANSPWIVTEDGLRLDGFETIPLPMQKPYPLLLWRNQPTTYNGKTYYNDGFPYHLLLKDIPEIDNTPVIYMGDKPITNIYYGNKPIIAVFFGKQRIM